MRSGASTRVDVKDPTDGATIGDSFTVEPRGPFSLAEAAMFGFGQRLQPSWDGVLRLAFCVDGYREQVGVELREDGRLLRGVVVGSAGSTPDIAAIRAQVSRILSVDTDADAYVAVGQRDPVVRRLLDAAPGLRPVLFYSPYEAAAWSVLSARRPALQMDAVRQRLSAAHGAAFTLAGEHVAAFPTPRQLLAVADVPGLTPEKVSRLHGVARAALDGQLDADRLAGMELDDARADVQSIPGIGPFYATLIVVRSTGCIDFLPTNEPRLLAIVGHLYGLGRPASPAELERIADSWRPFRTWVAVLVRAASARLAAG